MDIVCRRADGALRDLRFDLLYTHRLGVEGFGAKPFAYLFANRAGAARYRPAATYRFTSTGKAIIVRRSGQGQYTVNLGGLPGGGVALVTAAGNGDTHCQVASIRAKKPQKLGVRCWGPDGLSRDSRFTLTWNR